MPICPECRGSRLAYDDDGCAVCAWKLTIEDGTPVFLSDRDRQSPIFTAYTDLYEQIARDDLQQSIQAQEVLESEALHLLDSVGEVHGRDICEVGVGQGVLFRKLAELGPRSLVGVEVARAYLQRLAVDEGHRVVRANAEYLPFREEFDLVVASDVLEHVLNPADLLETARQALRPGGRLVLKVPHREDLTQYRTVNGYPYRFVHLRTFDRPLLVEMLENFGFEVHSVRYSGFYVGRWQRLIAAWPFLTRCVQWTLERRFPSSSEMQRIDPRLGRLLMRPVTVIVVGSRAAHTGN